MSSMFRAATIAEQSVPHFFSHSKVCQKLLQAATPEYRNIVKQMIPILTVAHEERIRIEKEPQEVKRFIVALQKIDPRIMLPRVSQELGGLGLSSQEAHVFKMLLSRASGALNFTLTQSLTAAAQISDSKASAKVSWLNQIREGKLFAMAQSPHLTRFESPTVIGVPLPDGGYKLSTKDFRWVTGWGHATSLIAGFFDLQTKQEITAVLPFKNCTQKQGGHIICSDPVMSKAAYSANTVSMDIENWYIVPTEILTKNPIGTFSETIKHSTNLDSYQAGVIAEIIAFIHNNSKQTLTKTVVEYFTAQLAELETMIVLRNKQTDIQPIRAFAITLFNDVANMARQLLLGRALLANDSLVQYLDLLCAEGALYAAAVPSADLLALVYTRIVAKQNNLITDLPIVSAHQL